MKSFPAAAKRSRAVITRSLVLLAVFSVFVAVAGPVHAQQGPVVLIVTADAADYLLAAGGTIAKMVDEGATAYLIRVTNDDKDSYGADPEETARRVKAESEAAAKIVGIKEVVSLGFRAWELKDRSFTGIRDRIIFYVRHYKPQIMFIPNPYTEYERVLDRYYAGAAAEDAWRAAAFENYLPAANDAGLKPHLTPKLYYYAQPVDPHRREPESTATFVPQPKIVDIASTLDRKLRAALALETVNHSLAMRLKDRFTATSRRLPLLDEVDEESIRQLVEINVRGLSKVCAQGTDYESAEEFRYAGVEFRIPSKYLQ